MKKTEVENDFVTEKTYLCTAFRETHLRKHNFNLVSMAKQPRIEDLTKGNVWTMTESDINQMLQDGKKQEGFVDVEAHYMNIIRPVFDIVYLDRSDEVKVKQLEAEKFDIFSVPSEGENNAIAIRKHRIKKVTDLTLENIAHLLPEEVLSLIQQNLGTGWQGLPLALQDIIESAFYVDCAVMPAAAMHRKGGIIDRRKEDGYEVLEIERGSWIEGIFLKPKPKIEKVRFSSAIDDEVKRRNRNEEEEEDDEDEEELDELEDETTQDVDEEEDMGEESPSIEDIDVIDDVEIEDEENE